MTDRAQVYLVPGFFGFTALGSLNYFQGVRQLLAERLAHYGMEVDLHEVETMPTGSIRTRAVRLLELIERTCPAGHSDIHLVGHSTGGLDARLLATPGVKLLPGVREAAVGERIRTVQTLSTPHFGTPLANFFSTLQGRNILYLLTMLATTVPGRYGIAAAAQLLAAVAWLDDFVGQRETFLDLLAERLLRELSVDRGHELWEFLHEVGQDQGAIIQLTPESIDLFNAAVTDRAGVRYVSHVSAAPPPLHSLRLSDFDSLYTPLAMLVYAVVHRVAAQQNRSYPYPSPSEKLRLELAERLPIRVGPDTNDGIVPAFSQLWGEIGHVAYGDHLDVVGQYRRVYNGRAYPGWLKSGAQFNDAAGYSLWDTIARVIATQS